MSDRDNCLFAVANLLKGRSQNANHFIQVGGPKSVMTEIMKSTSQIEIIELCLGSVKQLANNKMTFKQFL